MKTVPPTSPPPVDRALGWRERAGAMLILWLLVATFHGPSVKGSFVYDDHWTIVENAFIRDAGNVAQLLSAEPARQGVPDAGRPMLLLTEIVDHALWGLDARGFHLQNLLWHAATATLLFVAALAFLPFVPAFAAAAIFAAHPLTAEPVSAINYREDLLAAFFVLSALVAIGRARFAKGAGGIGWRILAVALAAAGNFSKENAAMASILLVTVDMFAPARPFHRRAIDWLLLAVPALAVFAWRAWIMGGPAVVSHAAEIPAEHASLATALPLGAWAFASGLARFVVPRGLSPEYPAPPYWAALLAAATVLLMLIAAWAVRRRHPWATFAMFAATAAALPTLGFLPIGNLHADRYMYLPSLALSLGLAGILVPALERWSWARRPGVFGLPRPTLIVSAVVIVLGTSTLRAARPWRNDLSLWTAASAAAPDSARAWRGLADARLRRGQTVAALEAGRRALALDPDGHSHEVLGIVLMQQGDFAGARDHLSRALADAQDHHRAERLNNLGHCELQLGLTREALRRFEESMRLRPDLDRAWLNAARAYLKLGEPQRAVATLRALLARDPESADGWTQMAAVLEALGQGEEARVARERAAASDKKKGRLESGRP